MMQAMGPLDDHPTAATTQGGRITGHPPLSLPVSCELALASGESYFRLIKRAFELVDYHLSANIIISFLMQWRLRSYITLSIGG